MYIVGLTPILDLFPPDPNPHSIPTLIDPILDICICICIASHFKRSPVTIGEAIIKVEDLLRRDSSFEKELNTHGGESGQGEEEKIPYFRCLTPFLNVDVFGILDSLG